MLFLLKLRQQTQQRSATRNSPAEKNEMQLHAARCSPQQTEYGKARKNGIRKIWI